MESYGIEQQQHLILEFKKKKNFQNYGNLRLLDGVY